MNTHSPTLHGDTPFGLHLRDGRNSIPLERFTFFQKQNALTCLKLIIYSEKSRNKLRITFALTTGRHLLLPSRGKIPRVFTPGTAGTLGAAAAGLPLVFTVKISAYVNHCNSHNYDYGYILPHITPHLPHNGNAAHAPFQKKSHAPYRLPSRPGLFPHSSWATVFFSKTSGQQSVRLHIMRPANSRSKA